MRRDELMRLLSDLESTVTVKDLQAAIKAQHEDDVDIPTLCFDVMMLTKPNPIYIAAAYGWSNQELINFGFTVGDLYMWSHSNTGPKWLGIVLEYWMRTHDKTDKAAEDITADKYTELYTRHGWNRQTLSRQLGINNQISKRWETTPPQGIQGALLLNWMQGNYPDR